MSIHMTVGSFWTSHVERKVEERRRKIPSPHRERERERDGWQREGQQACEAKVTFPIIPTLCIVPTRGLTT